MNDVKDSLHYFEPLKNRGIIPLLSFQFDPPCPIYAENLPNLSNVQGDVIYLFPKKAENFVFFRIGNVRRFKIALQAFIPTLTTSEAVVNHLINIRNAKKRGSREQIPIQERQIAFTRMGLNYLGVKENIGDPRFDTHCMRDDREYLGDQGEWDGLFDKPNPDSKNGSVGSDEGAIHGVITIAAHGSHTCTGTVEEMKRIFGESIEVCGGEAQGVFEGRARPDKFKGHEHFGYKDGISQPALRGLVAPNPGQLEVDPGVIVMGYPGDPMLGNRAPWTKDGSIFVFRKLEQDVLLFEDYVTKNGSRWREFIPGGAQDHDLSDKEGADLFGARMIGRWKSGAPLATCPFRDNKTLASDPNTNNDFDYTVRGVAEIPPNRPSEYYCPFTAHTRKTAPRQLEPYLSNKFLEEGRIIRAGLPYGPEVSDKERNAHKKFQAAKDIEYARIEEFANAAEAFEAAKAAAQVAKATDAPDVSLKVDALEEARIATSNAADAVRQAKENSKLLEDQYKLMEDKRGLLFACYQSSLDSGFVRQSVEYGNNNYFPIASLIPKKHGQDPIIGGPPPTGSSGIPREAQFVGEGSTYQDGDQVELLLTGKDGSNITVSGFAQVRDSGVAPPAGADNPFFVTSRGGEYFFVPAISTLNIWANT